MNIHLDITTKSIVHNTLSAHGQWIQHRFGKRKLELELSVEDIETVLENKNVNHITLTSMFGDPLDHSDINNILECINNYGKSCTIITYGGNLDALKEAQKYNFSLFIRLCDKVFLNADIDKIVESCKGYSNVMLENTIFKHNSNTYINDICIDNNWNYFETNGFDISGFCTSIINENGKWLYDVHSVHSLEPLTLEKTTKAWHRLKMFVKPILGQSILEKPKLPVVNLTDEWLPENDDVFVTVSGHVISNRERASIFTNALCNDWSVDELDLEQDYNLKIISVLRRFTRTNLEDFCIHTKRFSTITPFC